MIYVPPSGEARYCSTPQRIENQKGQRLGTAKAAEAMPRYLTQDLALLSKKCHRVYLIDSYREQKNTVAWRKGLEEYEKELEEVWLYSGI